MSYSEDATVQTAEIHITGRIDAQAFKEFVNFYSNRLDIQGECALDDSDALTIVVRGRKALVEMLATACSLGPAQSMVHDVRIAVRSNEPIHPRQLPPKAADVY